MKYNLSITPEELNIEGIKALSNALTPVGMARFLQNYKNGYGNYTNERHDYLDNLTMDDLENMLKK